jgi:hypothetical protein
LRGVRRDRLRRRQRSNDAVALVGERNRKQVAPSRQRWIDRERARASLHPGNFHRLAGRQRRDGSGEQVEIRDAIDLDVVGNASRAIAEADLCPHIEDELSAAGIAAERAASAPLIDQKRPRRFAERGFA